jgi:hypothetical protein
MRHFLLLKQKSQALALTVAGLSFGVQTRSTSGRLIPAGGSTLSLSPADTRTARPAVDIAPVARRTQLRLLPAAGAAEQAV